MQVGYCWYLSLNALLLGVSLCCRAYKWNVVSVAPGWSGGVWQSIFWEMPKPWKYKPDEAPEIDFSCGAGISLPFSLQMGKGCCSGCPRPINTGSGTCPMFPHKWSWAELLPGSQDDTRAQGQMRPTLLPRSIFCLIFSKRIVIEAWAGAWCSAINSMCLILTVLLFLMKTNWIYRCCLCNWTF